MSKRVGPEAKIIALFTALPDDSKRIVLEIIKSQTVRSPKSSFVPGVGRRSPRSKSADLSPANTETEKETATPVGVCAVPGCGAWSEAPVHYPSNENYHVFHSTIKKKGAGA